MTYVSEIIIKNEENRMYSYYGEQFSDCPSAPNFPRYTLDNPILPHNRKFLYDILINDGGDAPFHVIKESRSLKAALLERDRPSTLTTKSEKIYHLLFSPTIVRPYSSAKTIPEETPIKQCVTKFLLSLKNHDFFPKWARVDRDDITNVHEILQNESLNQMIFWNEQISGLRNKMATLQSTKSKAAAMAILEHPNMDINVLYTANFALLSIEEGMDHIVDYIMDYDQVCGVVDTSVGRTLTIESSLLHEALNVKDMPRVSVISRLYNWGDKQLRDLGNDGYKVLKTFESIIRTLVLRNEPYNYCKSFHVSCLNGLKDILMDLKLEDSSYHELLAILNNIKDIESSEIAGLYRHWMHPTVDELAGMKKVKGISDSKKPLSYKLIRRIKAAFNRSFVQEFIAQNRRWPPVKLVGRTKGPLKNWVNRKTLIFDESAAGYNWEDWADICFGKIFEFDYKVDILDLLDDKACSLPKTAAHQIFYKKFLKDDSCTTRDQRRVLINLLSQPEFDTKKLIERIIRRDIPEEWKAVGLHAKEREMKIEPRLFAILPVEVRAYFMLTEHNIAKYLFKYFPQQTMNLDADQLDRRLLQLASSKGQKDATKEKFTANLDFKSWNIYWTREAVESLFIQIGEMFGMPTLFTFTHEFFEMAMHYLSSYCCPPEKWKGGAFQPDQKCDCHLWFGHYGGLEGLRQKGWTLVTIAMLELVKLETGIESIITGQGDNQVIIFFIPKISAEGLTSSQLEQYYTDAIKKYITTIYQIAGGMGQQLKIEETWVSSRMIEYGKDLLIDGVFVSSVYKRVSRALEVTNELAPGLQSQVSHVFSVMQAACAKGFSWLPMYLQALLVTERVFKNYLLFDQANPTSAIKTLSSAKYLGILQMILFIPRSLGGLACLPFTEFILRGHPDPVTSALTHARFLEKQVDVIPPYMKLLLAGDFFATETDYLMLATAPDALNIDNVRTEQNIWKSLVKKGAKEFVKNELFKEILNLATDEGEKQLIEWMMSARPVFPRFLSLIYSATIYGAMAKVIGRFGNNRTLVYAAGPSAMSSSVSSIKNSHNLQWSNLEKTYAKLCSTGTVYLHDKCLTKTAQELRDSSWKVSALDGGIYGSTVPHPFEQMEIIENFTGDCRDGEACFETPYIFFNVHSAPDDKERHLSRGESVPYLSGRIRPKREQGIIHTTVLDSPIIAAAQLASNRNSVCDPGSPMDETIKNIVKSRTDIPIPIVESLIGKVYGGTLWHRLPDQYTSHEISLNCRPNITTHVYISTDTMAKYARGVQDYTLPFQSIFVAVNALLSDASARGRLSKKTIVVHAHLKCTDCTREIDPIKLTCEKVYDDTSFETSNPLIKSTTKTLPISARDLIQPPGGLIDNRPQNDNHRLNAIAHLITHRFHTNIQVAMRSLTPTRRFKSDLSLRMGDILAAGPSAVIKRLTLYLLVTAPNILSRVQYSHKQQLRSSLVLFANLAGHHMWENIGQFATLPEFVNALHSSWPYEDPGMDYGKGGGHTYRFLTRLLIKSINNYFRKEKLYREFNKMRIFLSDPNWTTILYSAQHMIITLWLFCFDLTDNSAYSEILGMPHSPTEEAVDVRVRACLSQPELIDVVSILQKYSPRVRQTTPESDARCNEIMLNLPVYELTKVVSPILPSSITEKLKIGITECTFTNMEQAHVSLPVHSRVVQKSRRDHEYKLTGNASTAMYKWVCALYHLDLRGMVCMTLGEGAGGLARSLLEIFHCDSIIFNTLIDSREFDPHRVTSYVPSELREWVDRIHELTYCREHSGDLTEEKTVARYSRWSNVSLVTCDAEVGVEDFEKRKSLVRNVARIASNVLHKNGRLLIKSFVQNVDKFCQEIKIISQFFQKVRAFFTTESSFENYEVFIEAWEVGSGLKEKNLSLNTISTLIALSNNRLANQPFQLIYPNEHATLERLMSFRAPNLTYSLRVFSNDLLETDQWNYTYISAYQQEIVTTIEHRLRTYKNLIHSTQSHNTNTAIIGAIVSEERFLNLMSVWYINLEILKGLLLLKNADPWDYRLRSYHPTTAYIRIQQKDLPEYEQRYARHFYHLLGHAKRRGVS
nr:MAG: RNA-dependent RNA polymerase [brine shrimp arlivirus 1]UNI74039.1 MAG: RNA-dependent RNA polymerase [brine shrimp arlivirus 1]UNI74049.1 MAG: RNA-dependent RNA polymerase [brine shrimp arlivirus 1]UNI74054.1 MAG: RNA-dependent RNA polymerase [brine shrimp arlivirus 1]UNI74059.1 MAG: RNA-dependent RNA polymerase [brine shrimp arlivirus 1]